VPARVRARGDLGEQPALADPGRPDDLDGRRDAALRTGQRGVERRQLRAPADE
jgi:hypothetical protein